MSSRLLTRNQKDDLRHETVQKCEDGYVQHVAAALLY